MLVIQARDKGITNPIEQGPDGSILASPDNFSLGRSKAELDSGILPRPVSLVEELINHINEMKMKLKIVMIMVMGLIKTNIINISIKDGNIRINNVLIVLNFSLNRPIWKFI